MAEVTLVLKDDGPNGVTISAVINPPWNDGDVVTPAMAMLSHIMDALARAGKIDDAGE